MDVEEVRHDIKMTRTQVRNASRSTVKKRIFEWVSEISAFDIGVLDAFSEQEGRTLSKADLEKLRDAWAHGWADYATDAVMDQEEAGATARGPYR